MTSFDQHRFTPEGPVRAHGEGSPRDGSWGLVIVTMIFVAFGVWSSYQINELKKLRAEVRKLRSEVDNHTVELSRLQVHLLDDVE